MGRDSSSCFDLNQVWLAAGSIGGKELDCLMGLTIGVVEICLVGVGEVDV